MTLRTHLSSDLTKQAAGQTTTLAGWVHRRRDHGGKIFIDLRDRAGLVQIVADPEISAVGHAAFERLRPEWCVSIRGTVRPRPEGQTNPAMASGEIEVVASDVTVLGEAKTPPFEIADSEAAGENTRYKYRYLDIRRSQVAENLRFRARVTKWIRDWMTANEFCEVQTPILTTSSPEGSRDFLVPSRHHKGKFYALPQAPQQFKQLLMVGGLERYFQIAPCLRDEDPRADRVAEHWQLDVEMSFVRRDEFLAFIEPFFVAVTKEFSQLRIPAIPFPRIGFRDALRRWGSDKPDLRFGLEIVELTDLAKNSGFGVFESAKCLRAIRVPRSLMINSGVTAGENASTSGELSRKDIDDLTEIAKRAGAGGLAWLRVGDESGPVAKNGSAEFLKAVAERTSADPVPAGENFPTDAGKFGEGDLIFFGAGEEKVVEKVLGTVRLALRDRLRLADESLLAWAWIVDFPMFAIEDGKLDFEHNPFSMPAGGRAALEGQDPMTITAEQYDLVANGVELFSGGVRNNDPESIRLACRMVGYEDAQITEMFGHLIEAYEFGAPIHAGLGLGTERLCSVLRGKSENIREYMAFPKTGTEEDLMMSAPSTVRESQLQELGIMLRPGVGK